ncbi:protein FAM214A [Octodon degus]|uniref:Atos homolog protein A n=1 Tax=Octodon degus TaxID=10160 RepID=A0A6P6F520_OCTDE|nr:protein FAM214A [Octodon degus]
MVYRGNKGPPGEDALDEYFEYDAEEFLVSLALLITEGRTPECSVKGRTESFHCPPAQSHHPVTTRHECSDKLAQCRQARRTRSEVTMLWRNSLPIMVEVALLPDCCYSDDGPSTEGADLSDPALEQDALLLERWVLEPVPRRNGGRLVEEKMLLLAVRSFVFFSQLSAWLSVSHGAVPRNILYRVSAADADLRWRFPQTPVEHVFPVPSVSHNVALKVSVQSLPRQSAYPVWSCSIHTNLGLYGERVQAQEPEGRQPHSSTEAAQCGPNSLQRLCGRQTWTMAPESVPHERDSPAPEDTAATRHSGPHPGGRKSPYGTSRASLLGLSGLGDMKPHETSLRTWKSLSVVDSNISSHQSSWQPAGKMNPLIDSLIQDRQEVIARIAQHLIHCDSNTPHGSAHPFTTQESPSLHPKLCQVSRERHNVRKGKDAFSMSLGSPEFPSMEDGDEGNILGKPDHWKSETHVSGALCPHQGAGEANPLIGSLLQERQDVIARIARHLEHVDPRSPRLHGPSSLPSKVLHSSCSDRHLWKRSKDSACASLPLPKPALLGDGANTKSSLPAKSWSSFACNRREKSSAKPQVRTQGWHGPPDGVPSSWPEAQNTAATPPAASTASQCSDSDLGLISRLENVLAEPQLQEQEGSISPAEQHSAGSSTDARVCTQKYEGGRIGSDSRSPESSGSPQRDDSKTGDSRVQVTMLEMSEYLNKYEYNCSNKDSAKPKTHEQNSQLNSIENYLSKNNKGFKCKKSGQVTNEEDKKEDSLAEQAQNCSQRKSTKGCLSACEQLKNTKILKTAPAYSRVWPKPTFHPLDGTSTRAFHPRTGLPLLSSPVPQRKTQSGCFDLDSSLLHLKSLSSRRYKNSINQLAEQMARLQECSVLAGMAGGHLHTVGGGRVWAPERHAGAALALSRKTSHSLFHKLSVLQESVLNYRLDPLGVVSGFTAEVGASGVFCPAHLTLPVEVSFYSVSDDNAPSPYMGVIPLESLGKRGYRVPPSGTVQVTLFNPNKTVVKMFVVVYDLRGMPANHQTFLRQRIFSVPVEPEARTSTGQGRTRPAEERLLRYLIHLRFQSSKSGKIYLHRDVRLLFSRKSMEVDSGAAYELKSYTESPTNPQFSPRC